MLLEELLLEELLLELDDELLEVEEELLEVEEALLELELMLGVLDELPPPPQAELIATTASKTRAYIRLVLIIILHYTKYVMGCSLAKLTHGGESLYQYRGSLE